MHQFVYEYDPKFYIQGAPHVTIYCKERVRYGKKRMSRGVRVHDAHRILDSWDENEIGLSRVYVDLETDPPRFIIETGPGVSELVRHTKRDGSLCESGRIRANERAHKSALFNRLISDCRSIDRTKRSWNFRPVNGRAPKRIKSPLVIPLPMGKALKEFAEGQIENATRLLESLES